MARLLGLNVVRELVTDGTTVLVLAFGFAMSWIFAVVGLAIGDPETAQAAGFLVMAPLGARRYHRAA